MCSFSLNDIATIIAVTFGISGFVLAILNYWRDNPKVRVQLRWDKALMTVSDDPLYDPEKLWGVVRVTNTGRRPVYLSHCALALPKGYDSRLLIIKEGIGGEKLAEGDPPKTYLIDQAQMGKYAKDWKKIRAQITAAADKN